MYNSKHASLNSATAALLRSIAPSAPIWKEGVPQDRTWVACAYIGEAFTIIGTFETISKALHNAMFADFSGPYLIVDLAAEKESAFYDVVPLDWHALTDFHYWPTTPEDALMNCG